MRGEGYFRFLLIGSAHLFAVQLLLPVLAPYFSSLGYSDSWISFVFGIFPFVMILTSVLMGELSDQVGRSWVLRFAFMLNIVAFLMYFFGAGWSIILGRVIDAVCFSIASILLLSKSEDAMSDAHRGKYTGLMLTVKTAIRLFAPAIGGYLADQYIGYPFFTTIGIFVVLVFTLRKSHPHKRKEHVHINPFVAMKYFFQHKDLRPMALLGPAMHLFQPLTHVFVPLIIVNEFGLSYTQAGVAVMIMSVGSLFQYFIGDLSDGFGRRKFIILGTLLKSVLIIYIALRVDSYIGLLLALLIYGVGGALWNVTAWTYMSDIGLREQTEGRVIGSYMSISKVGEVLGLFLAGFVVAVAGYHGLFLLFGAAGLVGVVLSASLFYISYRDSRSR